MYTFDDTALITHFNEKFSSVDPNGTGLLDRNSFKFVLQNLELELTEDQVMILYMEADVDGNFQLKYSPLIPRLATLAKEMMVRKQHGESGTDMGVEKEQVDYVVRGISKVSRDNSIQMPQSRMTFPKPQPRPPANCRELLPSS